MGGESTSKKIASMREWVVDHKLRAVGNNHFSFLSSSEKKVVMDHFNFFVRFLRVFIYLFFQIMS